MYRKATPLNEYAYGVLFKYSHNIYISGITH